MVLENLEVNNNTVSIWTDKCLRAAIDLEILNDKNEVAYFEYMKAEKPIFYINHAFSALPIELQNLFDQYLVNDIQLRISKIVKNRAIQSTKLGAEVLAFISRNDLNSMKSLIYLFNGLFINFNEKVLKETASVNFELQVQTNQLFEIVMRNTALLEELSAADESIELEEELDDLNLEVSASQLKNDIRKLLIEIYKHGKTQNKSLIKLYDILKDNIKINEELKSKILLRADLIFLTKGPFAVFINSLNQKYHLFRKNLVSNSTIYRNEFKEVLVNNKILHFEEICFLLGYKLGLFKSISSSARIDDSKYKELKEQIDNISYNVIGVDECTDYSVFDLYAINSLLKDGIFSSLTLCGDLMQKMTKTGINKWTDLDLIFKNNTAVSTLIQSYRQSATLINLAKKVYVNTQGSPLNLSPKFDKFDDEPEPLLFVDEDYKARVNWIYQKIKEIKEVYKEEFPSIAIFVPSQSQIKPFLEEIHALNTMKNIDFVDGDLPNTKIDNIVTVYDISKIKGLEFHAAYIFDLDKIQDEFGDDIVHRSIYVALSRAAFYMGVTLSQPMGFLKGFGFVEEN